MTEDTRVDHKERKRLRSEDAYLCKSSSTPAFPPSQSTRTQLWTNSPARYTSIVGNISVSTLSSSPSPSSPSSSSSPCPRTSSFDKNDECIDREGRLVRAVAVRDVDDVLEAKPMAVARQRTNFVEGWLRARWTRVSSSRSHRSSDWMKWEEYVSGCQKKRVRHARKCNGTTIMVSENMTGKATSFLGWKY